MTDKMMTLEELQDCNISLPIVREALAQAEKMLGDFLKTKEGINQKLFILFNGYMPVLIALITASFFVAQNAKTFMLLFFLTPLSCFFMISILLFIIAFRGSRQGTIGTSPAFWLRKDTISGDESTLAVVLAYLVHSYEKRIAASEQSNNKKMMLQNMGLYLSITGIILSAIIFWLADYLYILPPLFLFVGLAVILFLSVIGCYFFAAKS